MDRLSMHTLINRVLPAALWATVLVTNVQAEVPMAQRVDAAKATASGAAACHDIGSFYWEIGDVSKPLASGRVGSDAPARDTSMPIASASKWLYSAYVVQQRHGKLTDQDIQFLTFRSGYTRFRFCRRSQTVAGCMGSFINRRGRIDEETVGKFLYNGGHMEQHAMLMGLGNDDDEALAAAISGGLDLGPDWRLTYGQPQLAGGGTTSAGSYAVFLQAVMSGHLQIGAMLGSHAVCTNPRTCPDQAIKTPIPEDETWHYSIGHWVEDDPRVGDGAFSSPGAFGFYPWISADKQYYGIVARDSHKGMLSGDEDDKPAVQSVRCGRAIRAAWMSGRPAS